MDNTTKYTKRLRLLLFFLFIILLFINRNILIAGIVLSVSTLIFLFHPQKRMRTGWLPIVILVLTSFLGNLFFFNGVVIFNMGPFIITNTGLDMAILRTSRLTGLIIASKLLVLTMSMDEMINTLKEMCSPLNRLKLPVNEFFDTTLLTIQFLPFLKERLMEKYNSNTSHLSPKNFLYTASALIPILIDGIKNPELYIKDYRKQSEPSRKQSL